ncbi:MAG TPA: integrase core domain-containing protein [Candidatus Dormibacteraeota bacterium]|nr:integrase core domain-containing protein [Candidatus Dormibacteraeota bacterium]
MGKVLQDREAVLAEYVEHYNGHRPHRSLELQPPCGPTVLPAVTGGHVVRRTRVPRADQNEYSRPAA